MSWLPQVPNLEGLSEDDPCCLVNPGILGTIISRIFVFSILTQVCGSCQGSRGGCGNIKVSCATSPAVCALPSLSLKALLFNMVNAEPDTETMRRALEIDRDTEDEIPPHISAILERAVTALWRRIQTEPDTYLMNDDEFAVFNYFQDRFQGNDVARRATQRYWNGRRGQ